MTTCQSLTKYFLLTVFIHAGLETLGQPTSPALITMRLINRTPSFHIPRRLAGVNAIPVDASLEETRTP